MKQFSKYLSIALIFGGLLGVLQPNQSHGAAGKLEVNDNVIDRNDSQQQDDNTAYQVMPDLFLGSRNQTEREQQLERAQKLKTAKKQIFVEIKPEKTKKLQTSIGQKLSFTPERTADTSERSPTEAKKKLPQWLKISFAIAVLTFAVVLGLYLGKKYAALFKRRAS